MKRFAFFRTATPRSHDPRWWQGLSQWVLLLVGVMALDFSLRPLQVLLTLLAALATQSMMMGVFQVQRGWASALITAMGVSLLLRADNLWMHPTFTALAIAAKFTLMVAGRPLFNPANLAVAMGSLMAGGWISSGQWGRGSVMTLLIISLGLINVIRAKQWASSLGFFCGYAGALGLRMMWLGEPVSIFWHHLQSGAILIFAFFMISDPRTTPASHLGKWLFAALVGVAHVTYLFTQWQPNGAIYALPCIALLWCFVVWASHKLVPQYGWSLRAQDWHRP
jgi:Na+-transporting NADH:ubiquinone oxidoreductase subunit NqrB